MGDGRRRARAPLRSRRRHRRRSHRRRPLRTAGRRGSPAPRPGGVRSLRRQRHAHGRPCTAAGSRRFAPLLPRGRAGRRLSTSSSSPPTSTPGSSCDATEASPFTSTRTRMETLVRAVLAAPPTAPGLNQPAAAAGHPKESSWPRSSSSPGTAGVTCLPPWPSRRALGARSRHPGAGPSSQRDVSRRRVSRRPDHETRDFRAGGTALRPGPPRDLRRSRHGRDLGAELARHPADLVLVDALILGALDAVHAQRRAVRRPRALYDDYYRSACAARSASCYASRGCARSERCVTQRSALVTSLPELDAVRRTAGPPGRADRHLGAKRDGRADRAGEPEHLRLRGDGGSGSKPPLTGARAFDARVIVTTGPRIDPAALHVPAGVEVHRFVPHDELMPRVTRPRRPRRARYRDAALAHDVPVAVLPLDPRPDHQVVGRSLERAGVGRLLPTAGIRRGPRCCRRGPARRRAPPGCRGAPGALVRSSSGAAGAADALEAAVVDRAHPK